MADAQSPVIDNRAQLINAMSRGCKPQEQWRIGTEHEKFTFYTASNLPVPYEGDNGIRVLLEKMQAATGWVPYYDKSAVIALNNPNGGGAISLEPGGQFELSGAPLTTLHQTHSETAEHFALLKELATPMGINFLGLGTTPDWTLANIPVMPKSRYAIMSPYMDKVGTLGTSMMFRSCTVQVNLDFASEADMVKKLRVSLALQPIATALFANSPFLDGKLNGFQSFRSNIWLHTDAARTGMMPFAFEDGMGFERYADHALDTPMYFVIRNDEYINCAGESFRDFLEGKLPQLPGEKPTVKDWEDHLSTLFPEVRLKQFLEMRGADSSSPEYITALSAFWTGLLYSSEALDAAWDLVKDWTDEEREFLRLSVPMTALDTMFRGAKLIDIAARAVEISKLGLKNRAQLSPTGEDETAYLQPLEHIIASGKTQAQKLIQLYEGAWKQDISKVYADLALIK